MPTNSSSITERAAVHASKVLLKRSLRRLVAKHQEKNESDLNDWNDRELLRYVMKHGLIKRRRRRIRPMFSTPLVMSLTLNEVRRHSRGEYVIVIATRRTLLDWILRRKGIATWFVGNSTIWYEHGQKRCNIKMELLLTNWVQTDKYESTDIKMEVEEDIRKSIERGNIIARK